MFGFIHTEPIITNERVDDIPVLLTQLERMGVSQLLDQHFPIHGNWQGQSEREYSNNLVKSYSVTSRPSFKPRPSVGRKTIGNAKNVCRV